MVTSEQLDERMCNLIELNINAVRQKDVVAKDGALSELKFKLKDAHTAVNATCKVHLDFVVMPKGFAGRLWILLPMKELQRLRKTVISLR